MESKAPSFFDEGEYRIKPKEITITREKLADAWDNTIKKIHPVPFDSADKSEKFNSLCEELGL